MILSLKSHAYPCASGTLTGCNGVLEHLVLVKDEWGGGVLEQSSWIFRRERETFELVLLKFRGFSIVLF